MACPNLRLKTGIMTTYKEIKCSCDAKKIDVQFMKNVCQKDYKQCSNYKKYGIRNSQ